MIKNDIYISFSSDISEENQKWVNEFSSILKLLLDKSLKRDTKIVSSNNLLNDENYSSVAPVDIFSETKVFIVVLTKDYLTSTKSKQELATINSVVNGENDRLFKILISDIPINEQLDTIKELVPYIFFKNEKNINVPVSFTKINKYQSLKLFWLRLSDLVYNISFLITAKNNTKRKKEIVYLAETGSDQYASREVVRRELVHYGYTVLPQMCITSEGNNSTEYIKECIEKSDLSIHIISGKDGRLVDGTNIVYHQNNIAAEHSSKNPHYKRLLWISPDLVFENEEQFVKIEKLKKDSNALVGAELIQVQIEEFKSLSLRTLGKIESRDFELENYLNSQIVYIINNKKQEHEAKKMGAILSSKGIDVIYQENKTNKKELLINHKRNLILCKGVVVFNDSENINWVNSKMKDIVKSVGFERKVPIKAKALVVSDKHNISESKYNDFEIIDDSNGITSESVKIFIEKLKR